MVSRLVVRLGFDNLRRDQIGNSETKQTKTKLRKQESEAANPDFESNLNRIGNLKNRTKRAKVSPQLLTTTNLPESRHKRVETIRRKQISPVVFDFFLLHLRRRKMSAIPERSKLHIAMVVFQTGYAGNHVIMRYALNLGVSKLVFPLYRNIVALSVLAPSAFFLEKKERPAMKTSFLIQFFLLGLVGITLNQGFYIFGLDNTSPTFASATENAVPAVSFLMAAILGIEKVELKRKDGIAKVVGTFVSVAGSLAITLYKGPTIYQPTLRLMDQTIKADEAEEQIKNWTLGCLCLMGHCLCWSSWIVLQSPLLKKYPARFSFVSYSCFFAVFQFFGISAYFERDIESWTIRLGGQLYALLYTGLVGSAMVFAIQIYVVDRGGPLFVSAYLPLQTLLAALLATFALGEHFYLGGLIGAILIMCGLYLVVMGKSWENQALCQQQHMIIGDEEDNHNKPRSSVNQPLISS